MHTHALTHTLFSVMPDPVWEDSLIRYLRTLLVTWSLVLTALYPRSPSLSWLHSGTLSRSVSADWSVRWRWRRSGAVSVPSTSPLLNQIIPSYCITKVNVVRVLLQGGWMCVGPSGGYAMTTLDHYYGMNMTHVRVQWITSISFLKVSSSVVQFLWLMTLVTVL